MERKTILSQVKMLEFTKKGDLRGNMVIAEGNYDVPFDIKRIFFIYGSSDDVIRGQHANLKTEFVLINVAGTSKVKIMDGKGNEIIHYLDRPYIGLYLPNMLWKEMYDFSEDSVLLVLCSEHYDKTEYIRDFKQYIEIMTNKERAVK